ncbi:MAG: PPC domain-containing protein [Chloroflexota bacterium]
MRLRLRIASICGLLGVSLLAMVALAQDDNTPIALEPSTVSGIIDNDNVTDRYSFTATVGQTVTIRMEADSTVNSALDAQLFLFDANDQPLSEDDDSAGNRNAEIVFTPETSGTFIIEATRFRQNVGTTSGAYTLTLVITDVDTTIDDAVLNQPPPFTVEFTEMAVGGSRINSLAETDSLEYIAVGVRQGDFLRIELNTDDTLDASIRLLARINQTLSVVSQTVESTPTNDVIFATIAQTGWYLIEIERESGAGNYTLRPNVVSDTLLSAETPTEADFTRDTDTLFFVFNATINERVDVNLSVNDNANIQPQLTILDLSQTQLEQRSSRGSQARVSLTAPRSAPYIVRVDSLSNGTGTVQLQLRRIPADITKLTIRPAEYNEDYLGFISDDNPIDYYRFSGSAGELVTVQMATVGASNPLDPYVILADAELDELIFNDNVSASRTARIAQFSLPADGDYFILATRAGLSRGMTAGAYEMEITVGEIKLEAGDLTATLTWEGSADLNLFVRTESNFIISWANPAEPDGGQLQIDSNTGCETPTAQPIEHIYWNELPAQGDYTVWVWYQNDCGSAQPTDFTLTLAYQDENIFTASSSTQADLTLNPDERFEAGIRVTNAGASVVNRGTVSTPSEQQTASQGGDTLIVYGDTIAGSISDTVFARFYQFEGNEGDTVTITVERQTGDLDPIVVLRDAFDTNLAINDDISTDNRNSQITYTLPADGRYVISVTRFGVRDGTTTGSFNLTVQQTITESE